VKHLRKNSTFEETEIVISYMYNTEFLVPMLQVSTQIPVTYIDESDFSEASLIILTAASTEGMEEQIIVDRVS
jgi:hypothetical protein